MHKRMERAIGRLMNWAMQISQPHCVYVIDAEDYDAFMPAAHGADRRQAHAPADQLTAQQIG